MHFQISHETQIVFTILLWSQKRDYKSYTFSEISIKLRNLTQVRSYTKDVIGQTSNDTEKISKILYKIINSFEKLKQ